MEKVGVGRSGVKSRSATTGIQLAPTKRPSRVAIANGKRFWNRIWKSDELSKDFGKFDIVPYDSREFIGSDVEKHFSNETIFYPISSKWTVLG